MAYHRYLETKANLLNMTTFSEPSLPGLQHFTSDQVIKTIFEKLPNIHSCNSIFFSFFSLDMVQDGANLKQSEI